MASNIVRDEWSAYRIAVVVSNPASPEAGDPVRYGALTGIALTDEGEGGNIATETTVDFGPFIADLYVDDSGGSGVAAGATVFYDDTQTGSPLTNINEDSVNGYFYGFALETVEADATTKIQVMHVPSPGAGTLASGGVGTAQLADNAVTAAKLNGALATGFIPLMLASWREVASDDIQNLAAHGGILAKDSTPILEYTNGDTDSAIRLNYAAADVNEIAIQIPLPPDLDVTGDIEIHLRAAMGGATDSPAMASDVFFNEGDTKVEDTVTVDQDTTVTEYTITVAAADVPAGAQTMSIELTPGAHGTDALHVYAIWIEYTRTE